MLRRARRGVDPPPRPGHRQANKHVSTNEIENRDGLTNDLPGEPRLGMLWGGWSLRRYSPDGGLLTTMRCRVPTSRRWRSAARGCARGMSPPRAGLPDDALAGQTDAGGLFAFEAPAPGLPATPLRLCAKAERNEWTDSS